MARTMKDSGIQWIGGIPEDWLKQKVSYCLSMPITDGPHTTPELLDEGIPFVSAEAVSCGKKGKIDFNHIRGYISEEFYKECCQKYIPQIDDVYMIKSGATTGRAAIVDTDIKFTIWSPLAVFRTNRNKLLPKLLYYMILSDYFQKQIEFAWNFGTQQNIGMRTIEQLYLAVPPLAEQTRIADFLDKKCVAIDNVLEKTKASIEEYKKLKQSVITQAVTKGIQANRPMKDSGIEWIGQIPEDWEIKRLKTLFEFGKGLPITKENLIDEGLSVISYGQIHSKTNSGVKIQDDLIRYVSNSYLESNPSSLVHRGDFIFADTSEDLEGCGNCVFIDKKITLFAGYHTIIFKTKSENNNRYLAYLFKTDNWRSQIRSKVSGVKLFSISRKILSESSVILPPLTEQQTIADYLDKKCAEIDNIISKKEQLIKEVETYKKSLIYEYVTGKKEVIE